jgi:hypothetical protein
MHIESVGSDDWQKEQFGKSVVELQLLSEGIGTETGKGAQRR